MNSEALVLVLASPLLVPFVYGMVALFGYIMGRADGVEEVNRHGFAVYTAFVAGLVALVLTTGVSSEVVRQWFRLDLGRPLPILGALVAAVVVGILLFWFDYAVAFGLRRLGGTLLEGASRYTSQSTSTFFGRLVPTVIIVIAEEFLWRGVLIAGAQDVWKWTAGGALTLSAVAFGAHHYFFGLRNVLVKAIHGLVWGLGFLVTGSLLAPIASHFAFNVCAWSVGARNRKVLEASHS